MIISPKNLKQCPIHYLYQPIFLWMNNCTSLEIVFHIVPQCSLEGTNKIRINAWDDVPCHPEVHQEIFMEHGYYGLLQLVLNVAFRRHENTHVNKHIQYQN